MNIKKILFIVWIISFTSIVYVWANSCTGSVTDEDCRACSYTQASPGGPGKYSDDPCHDCGSGANQKNGYATWYCTGSFEGGTLDSLSSEVTKASVTGTCCQGYACIDYNTGAVALKGYDGYCQACGIIGTCSVAPTGVGNYNKIMLIHGSPAPAGVGVTGYHILPDPEDPSAICCQYAYNQYNGGNYNSGALCYNQQLCIGKGPSNLQATCCQGYVCLTTNTNSDATGSYLEVPDSNEKGLCFPTANTVDSSLNTTVHGKSVNVYTYNGDITKSGYCSASGAECIGAYNGTLGTCCQDKGVLNCMVNSTTPAQYSQLGTCTPQ